MQNLMTQEIIPKIVNWMSHFGLNLIAALAIIIFGRFLIKIISRVFKKAFESKKVDKSILSFFNSIINFSLWIFVLLAALSQLGIETTSFMAALGAAGLAVGLALQGSLSNLASGVLMIILRPFKVDDYVEAAGVSGFVKEISILTTIIMTVDNKKIVVPNSQIMNGIITNYTAEDKRRLDFVFGVGYASDMKKVKSILFNIIENHSLVMKDPKPLVRLGKMADSSLNYTVRVWVKTTDYWTVHFDIIEQVKEDFDKENINIPFPQMDVHLKK